MSHGMGREERAELVTEAVLAVLAAEDADRARVLVDLIVPRFADGAYVAVGGGGVPVETIALAWHDPTRHAEILAAIRRYHDGHAFSSAWTDADGRLIPRRFVLDQAASVTGRSATATLLDEVGGRSVVIVPLGGRGRLGGVLALTRGQQRPAFDEDELAAAVRMGAALGLAVDNARLASLRAAEAAARREAERALHDERVLLGAVFDRAPDGVAVVEVGPFTMRYVRVNPAFARLGEATPADVDGHVDDELGVWAIRPWREFARRAAAGGRVHELISDVANRWLVVDAIALGDVPGRVVITTHDVSERVQVEQQLRREEERSERAMRVGRVVTWEYDVHTAEIRVSREALSALFGDEVADWTAEDWRDAVHPDDGGALVDRVVGLVRGGEEVEVEVRVQPPAGGWIRVQIRAAPLRDAFGTVVGALGTAIDVTAQRRAEEQLGTLLDQLPGPAAIVDRDFEVIRTNSANRALGAHAEEVWYRVRGAVARAFETHDPVSAEISGDEGGAVWLYMVQAIPLRGDDLLDHVLVLLQDLSERRKIELERLDGERRVADAKRLDGLGLLAGGFAHDVNNLLTTVLAHAQLASMEGADDLDEHLDAIVTATRRAAELTDQLLAFAGRGRFALSPVNLTELVSGCADELRALMPAGADLEVTIEPDTPPALADGQQLRQVLLALVANAAEALGARGGGVRISAAVDILHADDLPNLIRDGDVQPGAFVRLEVSDDGVGMNTTVVERMFDPFFTTKFAGRGLGLAAVRGIVRAHRGALRVDSVANLGTRVVVWFPAAERAPAATRTRAPDASRGGVVLVVDDEPSVRAASMRLLARLGYACAEAPDGPTALELLRSPSFEVSVVLLDLTMPYMAGDEVAREILVSRPDAPIVLMSGYSTRELGEKVHLLGLAGVLHKPFSIDTLREVMDRVVRGVSAPEA